jgi:anti-sigma factor RsiW
MNCDQIKPLLHACADGELDLVNTLEVERHLQNCAACAAENKSLQALRAVLQKNDLAYRAPAALRKKILRTVHAAGDEIRPRENNLQWLWKFLAVGATAVAALALLLRPPGISERDQFLDEAVASHVRSLMVEHLTDVASSDQHTVKPWFDGKLDFAPDVKDFAAQNFPLLGGRLDYLNGRAVAALVYRHNKHLINVFVWPTQNADGAKAKTHNRRGYFVIERDVNGLRYCLVSDLNERELGELADLFGK